MSRWYRAYAGTVKDDKLAEVAVVVGCSRSVAIAVWHSILESAAETDDSGRFETTARRVAAALGEPPATIEAAFAAMVEIGMLEDGAVAAWKRRQYESDKSTERSRKHRERQRNGDATVQGRCETPPDTETETDTTPVPKGTGVVRAKALPEHQQILDCLKTVLSEDRAKAVVDHRKKKKSPLNLHMAALLVEQFRKIAEPDKAADLMMMRGWQGCEPEWCVNAGLKLAATSPQCASSGSQVFVAVHSAEWEAWQAVSPDKLKPIDTRHNGLGRYFPSRLPNTKEGVAA